ncbi:uncharacterized protein LAESUDRAFT_457006 [Laetiporus sulphureus 93-53]|uniref:F-box domain-containing protein n=1 Tax=Laetiporus sulphureus 93-53 TaxID=1314785 RepID=A0A165BTK9_9APHY|nr:uncharacterized protein LAESUDRAFT_457006 [Laetiporus sulphureus 93-53]KZT01626.1 hypothetical protein LAESUDRAFT_457006 [Laetiporus sulphureus 93-53]
MDFTEWKLELLADGTKRWRQRLVRIVEGEGKAGRKASSEVEPEAKPVATRTLPQLPIEVWENVIDHLWNHRFALRPCSLVCRAWNPPSCFHLHRPIEIYSVKGVMAGPSCRSGRTICPYRVSRSAGQSHLG